jgi:hypothetical protein
MAYKIPSDEEVVTAIQRVISKYHTINSQQKLKKLVEEELKSLDTDFRVSGARLRKLVLKSKYFHLEIDYKLPPEEKTPSGEANAGSRGPKDASSKKNKEKSPKKKGRKKTKPEVPKLNDCPICGSKVKKIKNKTLKGGFITIGYNCTFCPYHTGIPLKLPARYTFSIRRL